MSPNRPICCLRTVLACRPIVCRSKNNSPKRLSPNWFFAQPSELHFLHKSDSIETKKETRRLRIHMTGLADKTNYANIVDCDMSWAMIRNVFDAIFQCRRRGSICCVSWVVRRLWNWIQIDVGRSISPAKTPVGLWCELESRKQPLKSRASHVSLKRDQLTRAITLPA